RDVFWTAIMGNADTDSRLLLVIDPETHIEIAVSTQTSRSRAQHPSYSCGKHFEEARHLRDEEWQGHPEGCLSARLSVPCRKIEERCEILPGAASELRLRIRTGYCDQQLPKLETVRGALQSENTFERRSRSPATS